MDNPQDYSVVMAVYKNDQPEWFIEALESMLNQTVKATEIIVVADGALPVSLDRVMTLYEEKITLIRLPSNRGLWNALNVGIGAANTELIARMDSDDISIQDRIERQLLEFSANPNLDIVSGSVAEFESNINNILRYRSVPIEQKDIISFAKYRSPFNHPAVMMKKSSVMAVGGYAELMRSEDYDLWVRLLMNGAVAMNIDVPLLYYRIGAGNSTRKSTSLQQKELMALHRKFYKAGFLSLYQYILACTIRLSFGLLSPGLKGMVYKKVLRK